MTAREMQRQFGIQLNQFGEALKLHSEDIQYWLNKGQLELVKRKYNGINKERRGFEESQQRIDDLKSLVVNGSSPVLFEDPESTVIQIPTGFFIEYGDIPDDSLFIINHKSQITYNYPEIDYETTSNKRVPSNGKDKVVSNRFSQSDDIYKLLSDPFNTTKAGSPLTTISKQRINIYTDKTFVVRRIYFTYLKKPRLINIKEDIACELDEHLHDEVIQIASDLFLQNTRELKQRLQRETPTSNQQ